MGLYNTLKVIEATEKENTYSHMRRILEEERVDDKYLDKIITNKGGYQKAVKNMMKEFSWVKRHKKFLPENTGFNKTVDYLFNKLDLFDDRKSVKMGEQFHDPEKFKKQNKRALLKGGISTTVLGGFYACIFPQFVAAAIVYGGMEYYGDCPPVKTRKERSKLFRKMKKRGKLLDKMISEAYSKAPEEKLKERMEEKDDKPSGNKFSDEL